MAIAEAKPKRESWEDELLAGHRWGRFSFWFNIEDDRGKNEHSRLKKLWNKTRTPDIFSKRIIDQIISLEICNWKLEESILALCRAIGINKPADIPIGHMSSMTEERWGRIWAYYLTLKNWLPHETPTGYETLLKVFDPNKMIQKNILNMLGHRNELKELYVERFCLCLEFWIGGFLPNKSAQKIAHDAAVSAIDKMIKKLDPKGEVIPEVVLKDEGNGRLNLCGHKLFYRYDLIISSIGAGKWRAVMGRRATDGLKRADLLEKYLLPIESWLGGKTKKRKVKEHKLSKEIYKALGKSDDVKIFQASLLASLLRAQQLAARKLAESRVKK
jgi:hypothetical protein